MTFEIEFNEILFEVNAEILNGGDLDITYCYNLETAKYVDIYAWNHKLCAKFENVIISELSYIGYDDSDYDLVSSL